MATSKWDPQQYDRFQGERRQPFFDLLKLVQPRPDMSVIDLGCGTGELTALLHRELRARSTLGIDRSDSMLARAVADTAGGLSFGQVAVESYRPTQRVDLLFSNAALHWVDDHPRLFVRLLNWLEADDQLAVQMPANFDHPSHGVARELAREEPFRTWLGGYARESPVLPVEEYASLLAANGCREQHVRLQVYGHFLQSRDEVVEWVKGTLLVDYQERLDASQFERFLGRYRERLLPLLSDARPYFYPFKRILVWARR